MEYQEVTEKGKKSLGIYIHIPFCKSKCYYCDFTSFSGREDKIEQYVNALLKEINYVGSGRFSAKYLYKNNLYRRRNTILYR